MTITRHILTRVFAVQFYRNNSTFFLIVLAFAGGFMRGQDHLALGSYFVSSPWLMTIPVSVWAAYTLFVIVMNRNMVRLQENAFLCDFVLLPARERITGVVTAICAQLIPVYAYGAFLIALAYASVNLLALGIILLACATLTIIGITSLHYQLTTIQAFSSSSFFANWINRTIAKPYFWFCTEGAIRRQTPAIALYKVTSLALLYAVVQLCRQETYDIRMPALFVLAAFLLNIAFVLEWHRFENDEFRHFRQMPFSLLQRYGYQLLVIILITLPEAFMLFRSLAPLFTNIDAATLYLFGISTNLLLFNVQYVKDRTPEQMMPLVYVLGIVDFFLILSGVPLWAMVATGSALAFLLLHRYYYRFEYRAVEPE